ncbi:MAG: SDR family oxidoreductase [Gemmatimonadota bacterium]|nr:SDR family oxidoreductase [Gemmatimonadota bacterium]MDH5760613.1 SDR family oxidoreductase [Gemmatimonadota bacterium]
MPDLTGKVAIVSGSTKGIGLAVAEHLVRAGCSVVISGRSREGVRSTVERIEPYAAGTVMGLPCDVRRPDECQVLVERAVDGLGRLDILVNNAGLGIFRPITELGIEEFQAQVETNLNGVFYLSRSAIPHLADTGDGWIINVGSLASRNAFAGGTGYNASKFGLLGLTEATMLDVRDRNIRVSIVMPGSVNTAFWEREQVPERTWRLEADDCALAVMQLLDYPPEAHVSRIEMRPSRPPAK